MTLRGIANKQARELGLFKLLRIHADPSLEDEVKTDAIAKLENGVEALYPIIQEPVVTEEYQKETMEEYYKRVIAAARS